ncbi:MAG: hypothetical protein JKY65_31310 [Planctomycetes bacterium]|nr:hypothetical protein [Planctomycetota bacterium]
MLARLNADERIAQAYLAADGTRLLLQGAANSSREEVLAACGAGLEAANLQPQALSDEEAQEAWRHRDEDAWLLHTELWKLSWKEAETFADRLLAVLIAAHGEGARSLRPLLVESLFEGVRPKGGGGPESSHWKKGASVEERRTVLLREARKHLSEAQVADVGTLFADRKRVREILRPKQ